MKAISVSLKTSTSRYIQGKVENLRKRQKRNILDKPFTKNNIILHLKIDWVSFNTVNIQRQNNKMRTEDLDVFLFSHNCIILSDANLGF